MTPDERDVVMSLAVAPGRPRTRSPEDVLTYFKADNGQKLGLDLLRDAVERRDATDVEMALIVGSVFGFSAEYADPLIELSAADWHFKHEDVAAALGVLHPPAAVDALRHLAVWVPDYLEFDEGRTLARKAIRALARIPGPHADQVLHQLAGDVDETIREFAVKALARREDAED